MFDENTRELTISRTLDAPLERVWRAWTDGSEIQKWWGPDNFTIPHVTWQPEAGGEIDLIMLAGSGMGEMSGTEFPMTGRFEEVVPSQKLVFASNAILDNQIVLETRNTITFEAQGEQTLVTVLIEVSKVTSQGAGPLAGMEIGWNQQMNKLSDYVKEN